MHVRELWRFPVKSLQGEQLDRGRIESDGLLGDRRFALLDLETNLTLTGRRVPELLFASAGYDDEHDEVTIVLPDGTKTRDDADLSAWLRRPVRLIDAHETAATKYESPGDFENDADWHTNDGPGGAFHDTDLFRVSMVSTATLGALPTRRFRANVVLDGAGEDAFVGKEVDLGEARINVIWGVPRCVMVTRPQPGGIERDLDVLRTINRDRKGTFAIGGQVVRAGVVRLGDTLTPAQLSDQTK